MEDECGFDLLGAAGSNVPFGPMTEAEYKASQAVLTMPAENIWLKPSTWFKEPAWKGGPPRWQVTIGAVVGLLGLGLVGVAFIGKPKGAH